MVNHMMCTHRLDPARLRLQGRGHDVDVGQRLQKGYCSLIPADVTMSLNLSDSAATNLPNSAGDIVAG